MPPKTRITREMVIDAAVDVAGRDGYESICARTVAERLRCSTQPVMYHFATIEELKRAAYARADSMHSAFLMRCPEGRDPVLSIGLNYIRFAAAEPRLFRFLFQSGYARAGSLSDMMDSEELAPVIAAMREGSGLSEERTKEVFFTVALFAHGYASIIANNSLGTDEEQMAAQLERCWNGALLAAKREDKNEDSDI